MEAQLTVLDVRAVNTEHLLAIEERSWKLDRRELDRMRRLLSNNTISEAAVDREERSFLAGEQAVQNLRNAMNLLPAERSVLEATRDQLEAQLETARRNLSRTRITAPFNSRIAAANVEQAQFATQGQVLVVADSLDVAEVTVQIPVGSMLRLLPPGMEFPGDMHALMSRLREAAELKAIVRLRTGGVDTV